MNYVERKFSLDVDKTASQRSIEVNKGDTLNRLVISLTEHGCPYDISEECRAFYIEGDVMHSCVIDDNRIIYDLATQTVGTVGKHPAEIRLVGYNDEVITTARFAVIVMNTIYDDDVQETVPQTDVDALTGLISEAAQLVDEVNESLANGEFKGEPGRSGVYVGSGTPPDGENVQVDPNGDGNELVIPDVLQDTGDSEEDTMSQKAITEALNVVALRLEQLRQMIPMQSRITDITLYEGGWIGTESPYYQVVAVDGVTNRSQVDLTPTAEQLETFRDQELSLTASQKGGVVTVKAVGDKPIGDHIVQVTITEVTI